MNPLRVFIADDEAPARERLRELLADIAAELSTEVAGEAQNGLETVERLPASGISGAAISVMLPLALVLMCAVLVLQLRRGATLERDEDCGANVYARRAHGDSHGAR